MEGVRRGSPMRRGIRERIDDLQLFDDRPRPPMGDNHRQRVIVPRANVYEMNIEPVDLGHVLRQGVEPRFYLPPVVVGSPIADELLHRRQSHALRLVGDGLPVRPLRHYQTLTQVSQPLRGELHAERADRVVTGRGGRLAWEPRGRARAQDAHRRGAEKPPPILV
jgi:hypothetical protein